MALRGLNYLLMAKEKETTEIIDLTEKVEVTITKLGAEMPSNDWTEGDVIEVHPKIADDFVKRKIAIHKK